MESGMKNKLVYVFFAISVLTTGCKFVKPFFVKNEKKEERKDKREEKKEVKKEKNNPVKIDSAATVKKDTLRVPSLDTALARRIINNGRIDYKNLQFKAKMHYESAEQKQNFTVNFRLKKNEVIWASLQVPIVGEVARAIITPDSVKAIDKFNKRAYLYTYRDLQKLVNIDVDFNTLQDIIIGNAIAVDGKINEIKELAGISTFFIKGIDFVNQLSYSKSDSSLKQIQLQTMRPVSSSSILINLSNYKKEDNFTLSTYREYYIQDVKGAAELNMDINKFEFNKEIDFPFRVDPKFKQ
jgi:hypothetical protein